MLEAEPRLRRHRRAPRRGAVAERMGGAARRGAGRAARSAPAVGRAGGGDVARASLPRARRAGPHARGAVLCRHGFRADGPRLGHHRARVAEAGRQRRAARRSRGRARRLSARGSQELDALARAGRISRRRSCVPPCSGSAISTPSFTCSSGTRRRIGRATPPRIARRSSPCSVRCGTSSWPATGSAICWPRSRRAQDLTARERVELERLGRQRRAAVALPQSLVAAFAETRSHCLAAWEQARRDESYAVFLSPFAQLLKLMRERAEALRLSDDLYDGLLDEHEPGMRRARLDPLLRATGARLRALVPELAERTRRYANLLPRGVYHQARQRQFCAALLRDMGFDFARGRLDRSTHPFTMMAGENDVRAHDSLERRRSAARDLRDAARRRPRALRPRAAARAARHAARRRAEHGRARVAGAALGESRRPQRRVLAPLLRAAAARVPRRARRARRTRLSPRDQRHRAGRRTASPPTRPPTTCTCSCATSSRSRCSTASSPPPTCRALGTSATGITSASAPRGRATAACRTCTGRSGEFGYFPTYTIGNLYAAQLVDAYGASHDLDAELASGNLGALRGWLAEQLYAHGAELPAETLIERITGRTLDVEPFFRRLERRVAELE